MKIFKIVSILLLSFLMKETQAAVTGVTYKIVYNSSTCMYDVFLTVTAGSTTSAANQKSSTAQLTIVVPTGTTISNLVSYYPASGTQPGGVVTFNATNSALWTNSNSTINYTTLSGYDAYTFKPDPSGSYYPPMIVNTDVHLFSIKIATTSCGVGIRLWKNNVIQGVSQTGGDPTSANYQSADYNNGMGIGSGTQIYTGNGVSSVTPPNPVITSVIPSCTGGAFGLAATVTTSCASPFTYAWTGPSSFTNTSSSFSIASAAAANSGLYRLVVTDANNCTTTFAKSYDAVNCSPLPIKLSSFIAIADKCTASLVWTANVASNFKEYEVQYSRDAKNFETIGKVSAAPNQGNRYTFEYPQSSGKGYYRLKVIDQTGADTYSETITVVTNCPESAIKIFPNPATSVVHIQGIEAGDEVKIMDALGQVITSAISPGNIATLDLTPYAPGVYSVMINKGAAMTKAGQVVKQ